MLVAAAMFALAGTVVVGDKTVNLRQDLEQSADRAHRRDDRLGNELKPRRLENEPIDFLLRAQKNRPAVGERAAERFGDGDPGNSCHIN